MATDKSTKNTVAADDEFEQEDQVGFPPYWTPQEPTDGKYPIPAFTARVIALDTRDPDFMRFILENTSDEPLVCMKGPADDADEISVAKGEQFSCSVYAALPLERYFGIVVKVTIKGRTKVKNRREQMWNFGVFLTAAGKKLVASRREESGGVTDSKVARAALVSRATAQRDSEA